MIRFYTEEDGWYGDCTLKEDYVSLHRDSHLVVNGSRLELPHGQSNLLQLVCLNWRGQVLIAGQGQSNNNWIYRDGKWIDLGPSFATFSCAFSTDSLYFVCGPNLYRTYDLQTGIISDPISRVIGSNGIRYIDFSKSIDGIVTGDKTYGPSPYDLSQWTSIKNLTIGQSYVDGAIAIWDNKRYKLEHGDTQFLRLHFDGERIAITIVKMLEKKTVFYWMSINNLVSKFPIIPNSDKFPPIDKQPGPINNEDEMNIQAPNKLSTVQRMIRLHPEVDTMDEDARGKIIDYFCKSENSVNKNKPWGRKARKADGSNKNTDGLTYLRSDGKFEIIDVISGSDGSATWDHAGIFDQGENGFWAEAEPVNGSVPVEPPGTKVPPSKPPVSNPINVNKDDARDGANEIIHFYNTPSGLNRQARGIESPIVINDQAVWDWIALFLTHLASGKTKSESLNLVLNEIKTFPEYTKQHGG